MSFGSDLQRERERRGVSLDAIASSTKLSPRHLHALEDCAWTELPGGIFTRGMVRSYCRCLGLSEPEWLARLDTDAPAPAAASADWIEFAENVKRTRAASQPRMRRRWWGVLFMGAALAALSWAAWRYVLQPRIGLGPLPSLHALLSSPKQPSSTP